MSGQHTPWAVIQSPTDPEMSAVHGVYLVADNLPIEDAILIAAAPEMRSALEGVMGILGRAESNASGNPEFDHVGPRVAAARAALAKARGGAA
jgi:hypothetical protein